MTIRLWWAPPFLGGYRTRALLPTVEWVDNLWWWRHPTASLGETAKTIGLHVRWWRWELGVRIDWPAKEQADAQD